MSRGRGLFTHSPSPARPALSAGINAQSYAQSQDRIDIAQSIAQRFPLKMASRKSPPKPAAESKTDKVAANMYLDRELKSAALDFVAGLGYSLSEYVAEMLEVQLIRAGKRKPRKPVVEPVPELLERKRE